MLLDRSVYRSGHLAMNSRIPANFAWSSSPFFA
ncbi:hypothetical protein cypCar_00036502 [Cyprinus carpio]|nr:hypothetical protein cypCar_00036502 [Cyprinus carpio]